jgi:sucrose-6-phosphate hydrolase SacC (GH32 family)
MAGAERLPNTADKPGKPAMTRLRWIVVAVVLSGLPLWAAEERVVFEDRFDGKLGEGWSWLRENPPDAEHWIRFDDFRVVQLAEVAAEKEEGFRGLFDGKTLDGWKAAGVVDNNPKQQDFSGILGLQLHSGPPTTAQFKDIRMKILKPTTAAPKPPAAVKPAASASAGAANLRDKTLVVWVAPADLTQRGGSALTIDDVASHFDGIVFGELAPKRWMAGSDFFRRTERDQGGWPEETADSKTVVQVAVAYKGQGVTIYRNGQRYAQYTMASPPQEFGPQSVVVLGKRHLDQADSACFGGAIEDARIYDLALSAEQIAALKPREPSDPKPWAWWTFDGKEPRDRTGRFAAARLVGGAKVEGGRLVLDGRTGTMLAARRAEDFAAITGVEPSDIQAARRMREHLLADPHRPAYHFVIPEGYGMPFDPNGAIFWKGRYHLFYIFQDPRGHNWGHASSADLLHWRHHPTGLVSGMFSGNCFVNKEGRPTMCYHQVGQGNAMAVALDDELNAWEKLASNPITPKTEKGDPHHDKYRSWDPYGWLEGDTYYAIFGGERPAVAKSASLGGPWRYVGDLMAGAVDGVDIHEDVSCADFFDLGGKRMLLCISHRLGCRYYLGQWKKEQFHPEFHERMSWVDNAFFAPESLLDAKGRRIMWAWIFDQRGERARRASGWSGEMSLARELMLGEDGRLRMRPVEELQQLRCNEKMVENVAVEADKEVVLDKIAGNTIELLVEIEPQGAKQCGVKVCRSPDGAEQTLVYYDAADKKLKIDVTRASLGEGPKNVEAGPFELKEGETLTLRVFVDRSVVEAFANDRQAAMRRIYPTRADSVGVSLFSQGGAAKVRRVKAWDMAPSNPY